MKDGASILGLDSLRFEIMLKHGHRSIVFEVQGGSYKSLD